MLFRKGIDPKWEDPKNECGGSLMVQIDDIDSPESIDEIWKNLVFSIIGHSLPHSEHINGIRFMDKIKKYNHIKIEVWLDSGLAKYPKGSPTYNQHQEIKETLAKSLKDLISQTIEISVHLIIFKDHYTANKT